MSRASTSQSRDLLHESTRVRGLSAASQVRGHPVRFHLSNGEKIGLACMPNDTFGDIKAKIWLKKKFKASVANQFVFRLAEAEVFFTDSERFSRLLNLSPVFREASGSEQILAVSLVPVADIGDKVKRQLRKPSDDGPYLMQGTLFKRGRKAGSSWKKRYFVLEDFTLFYFDGPKTFFAKGEAIDYVPLGSCQATRTDDKYRGRTFCFELKAEHLGRRNFLLCAESEEEQQSWLRAIYTINFRRVKTVTVHVVEELTRRGVTDVEGIFRKSGSHAVIQQMKQHFDHADYPDLAECKDEHALAGLLKLCLRELSEPILTFAKYRAFVAIGDMNPANRASAAADILTTIPQSNRGYLEYLTRFLHMVSLDHETHKMTAKNLAIVFAPNILRPVEDTAATALMDSKNVLAAVETLIGEYEDIWGRSSIAGRGRGKSRLGKIGEDTSGAGGSDAAGAEDGGEEEFQYDSSGYDSDEVAPPPPPSFLSVDTALAPPPLLTSSPSATPKSAGRSLASASVSSIAPPPPSGPPPFTDEQAASIRRSVESNSALKPPAQAAAAGAAAVPQRPADAVSEEEIRACEKGARTAADRLHGELDEKLNVLRQAYASVTHQISRGGIARTADVDELSALNRAQQDNIDRLLAGFERYTLVVERLAKTMSSATGSAVPPLRRTPPSSPRPGRMPPTGFAMATGAGGDNREALQQMQKMAMEMAAKRLKKKAPAATATKVETVEKFAPHPPRGRPASVHQVPKSLVLPSGEKKRFAVAQYDYEGGHRVDEITFKDGAKIEILDDTEKEEGWWKGRLEDGSEGWFPGAYVQVE